MDGTGYSSATHICLRKNLTCCSAECTKIAVQRRIQRLREQVNRDFNIIGSASGSGAGADDPTGEASSASAPASPEKKKRRRPASKGKVRNGKAAKKAKKGKDEEKGEDEPGEIDTAMEDEED